MMVLVYHDGSQYNDIFIWNIWC